MKILFVGDLNEYGRSFQRYKTLLKMGHDVLGISMFAISSSAGISSSPVEKIFSKLKIPLDLTRANNKILDSLGGMDLVWIEKGNTIYPRTLRRIKEKDIKLISLSEDDMYAWHNRSLYYSLGLKYYDVVFTTKKYNLEELKKIGAKRTELFLDAYDEDLHRPIELSDKDKNRFGADVGFIGTFEEDRARRMLYCAENGASIKVWGNGWEGWKNRYPSLQIEDKPIYGEDYVKAINATKINLCFLRKMNRDETTSRSVEIPACGGFMLGERTKRHLEFFEEGKEAEFFDNNEEMLKKIKQYLGDENAREKIALAGRKRCLVSGYSTKSQASIILSKIF